MPINSGQIGGGGGGLSSIMQMVQMMNKSGGNKAATQPISAPATEAAPPPTSEELTDNSTAMDRRYASAQQDPNVLVHNAIQHMHDIGGNMDWETAHSIIQPLLQAKYFGANPMPNQSQGAVNSGNAGGGNGNAGSIIGAVAALA